MLGLDATIADFRGRQTEEKDANRWEIGQELRYKNALCLPARNLELFHYIHCLENISKCVVHNYVNMDVNV